MFSFPQHQQQLPTLRDLVPELLPQTYACYSSSHQQPAPPAPAAVSFSPLPLVLPSKPQPAGDQAPWFPPAQSAVGGEPEQQEGVLHEQQASNGRRPAERLQCPHEGCDMAFMHKSALSRHARTHTGEKPFLCPYSGCDKAFSESGNLSRHKRCHTGEKPFVCSVPGCGKAFSTLYHQKRHEKVHSKPLSFECERCGKSFVHRRNALKHSCQ